MKAVKGAGQVTSKYGFGSKRPSSEVEGDFAQENIVQREEMPVRGFTQVKEDPRTS